MPFRPNRPAKGLAGRFVHDRLGTSVVSTSYRRTAGYSPPVVVCRMTPSSPTIQPFLASTKQTAL